MYATAANPDVHQALDLIAKIEAGRPLPPKDRREFERIRGVVTRAAANGGDLGEADQLGIWPVIVAQLAAMAAIAWVGYKISDPVIQAAKIAGPVVTYGAAAWILWWLAERARPAAKRRAAPRRSSSSYEDY